MGLIDNVAVNVGGNGSIINTLSTYVTKVLKPNIINGKNVLTQEMMPGETGKNTKYVIKYDYDLNEESVSIPNGCLIEFDGGSISNGTIVFDDTILIYDQQEEDVLKNVTMLGNYEVSAGGKGDKKDNTNGMGKIYLKKNKGFAEQLTQDNTIYVIQYDFDLNNAEVTIPENCVLEFDGGSIGNGTLIGQNTVLANPQNGIFKHGIKISGTWKVGYISTDFFEDLSEENALDNVEALNNAESKTTVYIGSGDYYYNLATTPEYSYGLTLKSNTEYIFNGTIYLITDSVGYWGYYNIVKILNANDIYIHGNGSIIGDKDDNESHNESGHGIGIHDSSNIRIEGINISKCIGDGIYISSRGDGFKISNCNISYCGRQGISIVDGRDVDISYCDINHIWAPYGSSAMWAIDVEPNNNRRTENIYIKGCNIHDTDKGICATHQTGYIRVGDIYIENNIIDTTQDNEGVITKGLAIQVDGGAKNVVIKNNTLIGANPTQYIIVPGSEPTESTETTVYIKGECIFDCNKVEGRIYTTDYCNLILINNIITAIHLYLPKVVLASNNIFNMTCGDTDNDLFLISGEFCRNTVRVLKSQYRVGCVFRITSDDTFIHDNILLDASIDSSIYGNVYSLKRGYSGKTFNNFNYPKSSVSNVNFTKKNISTKATTSKITNIKGKTSFIHQILENGNFADNSKWNGYTGNPTIVIENNKMTVTCTTAGIVSVSCTTNNQIVNGHVYLVLIKTPDEHAEDLRIEGSGTSQVRMIKIKSTIYYKIYTAASYANSAFIIRKNDQQQGDSFVINRVCLIDLTELYGDADVPSDDMVLKNINVDLYYDYGKSMTHVNNFKIRSNTRNGFVIDECPIDVMAITSNTGLRACGSDNTITYDTITTSKYIRRTSKRAYQTDDENNPAYTTDGTNTIIPLVTPVETDITFDKQYSVKEDGFEEVIVTDLSFPSVPVLSGVIEYSNDFRL